jgi:hypothetical protein
MLFQCIFTDFILFSAGALEPLALARSAQIDPREEHGELRGLEFDAVLGYRGGQLEASSFESFIPDRQPVAVKVEDLDSIPAPVEEQEEMAGQRILPKALLDQSRETVKAFA